MQLVAPRISRVVELTGRSCSVRRSWSSRDPLHRPGRKAQRWWPQWPERIAWRLDLFLT